MEYPKPAETDSYQASPNKRYAGFRLRPISLQTTISMMRITCFVCHKHWTKLWMCFVEGVQNHVQHLSLPQSWWLSPFLGWISCCWDVAWTRFKSHLHAVAWYFQTDALASMWSAVPHLTLAALSTVDRTHDWDAPSHQSLVDDFTMLEIFISFTLTTT